MRTAFICALALAAFASAPLLAKEAEEEPPPAPEKNPVAVIETSKGVILVELLVKEAPQTVKNFLDLAEGQKEFTDPKTGEKVKRPFYDGLIFHRVIKGFMIQGGCPLGNGMGGPGYAFEDEINAKHLGLDKMKAMSDRGPHPWLLIRSQAAFQQTIVTPICKKLGIKSKEELQKNIAKVQAEVNKLSLMDVYENLGYKYSDTLESSKPVKGVLAMANSGPNTNGSQFFINLGDTPHLTGKHTVFGRVVGGMEVVEAIGEVPVDGSSRPIEAVKIVSIRERGE